MKTPESMKLRIKDNLHVHHRSRQKQKFVDSGFRNFAEHEILELLLFYAIPQQDTNPTAHRLLNKFKSLKAVFDAPIENLLTIDGIGENSAILIKLIPALLQEYGKSTAGEIDVINNQLDAKRYCANLFVGASTEQFYVICLNPLNKVITCKELSSGSATKVDVKIRSITDFCFKNNCDRILIAHNHPQSDARPSNDDLLMTQRIFNSCVLNEIDVLDHLIISPTDAYSLAETNLMQELKMSVLDMMKYNLDKTKFQQFSTSTLKYLSDAKI